MVPRESAPPRLAALRPGWRCGSAHPAVSWGGSSVVLLGLSLFGFQFSSGVPSYGRGFSRALGDCCSSLTGLGG